jgi:CheY-like chemotaxis protein
MATKILVVDDDPDTLRLLKLILESSGFEVLLAENGVEALTLTERQPALVLCDVLMPNLDGYETLTAIRSNPATKDIPVLMLSALGQERDVQRALDAGANGYVVKPFSLRPLVSLIQEHLRVAKPAS